MVEHEVLFTATTISHCSFWRLRRVILTLFERGTSSRRAEKGGEKAFPALSKNIVSGLY